MELVFANFTSLKGSIALPVARKIASCERAFSSSDQSLKILKKFLKRINKFVLIDQSECYILFVTILIGHYGQ